MTRIVDSHHRAHTSHTRDTLPRRERGDYPREARESDPYMPSSRRTSRTSGASRSHRSAAPSNSTTPYHAGTQNDCSLHTMAAMTGYSEQQIVQALGLSERQLQHVSAYGMEPNDFTAALNHLNGNRVNHNYGPPSSLAGSMSQLPDGHQFALGVERSAGIGHVVSAQRVGSQLVITDRQSGQRLAFNSERDLQDYLSHSNAAQVHTWYDR
jgi:hypothetical protein